jgi:outer membrane protein assembly factor BamE (lipoprotein component of BamABCDE complex)
MRHARLAFAAIAAALLVAGCSKATTENYDKVEVGMKKEQVHQMLGNPSKVDGEYNGPASLWVETFSNDPIVITITYNGDEVGMKSIAGDQSKPQQ